MVKIKPGIFNIFDKQMILNYLESVKMTHTPLDSEKNVNIHVVNQNIQNTQIINNEVTQINLN
jgi:hypothetical protein